jgi:hypothetical protein
MWIINLLHRSWYYPNYPIVWPRHHTDLALPQSQKCLGIPLDQTFVLGFLDAVQIQATEQPPMQVGGLAGSLPGSLGSVRRILTVDRGWRPCGPKAMYHERRLLVLERRGRAGPCRRAVTLQDASATPSSAGRGSPITRQSFIPAGGGEGNSQSCEQIGAQVGPCKLKFEGARRH